jgi:hypothetical protein
VQTPPSTAWVPGLLPAALDKLPLPTLVIRQTGEAWTRPFTAVFEAVKGSMPASVLGVQEIVPKAASGHALGLRVTTAGGRRQTIMSSDGPKGVFADAGLLLDGRYGIVAELQDGLDYLFLGSGREVAGKGYAIRTAQYDSSAALWQANGHWFFTGSHAATLRVPAASWSGALEVRIGARATKVRGRLISTHGQSVWEFALPAMAAAPIG